MYAGVPGLRTPGCSVNRGRGRGTQVVVWSWQTGHTLEGSLSAGRDGRSSSLVSPSVSVALSKSDRKCENSRHHRTKGTRSRRSMATSYLSTLTTHSLGEVAFGHRAPAKNENTCLLFQRRMKKSSKRATKKEMRTRDGGRASKHEREVKVSHHSLPRSVTTVPCYPHYLRLSCGRSGGRGSGLSSLSEGNGSPPG